MNAIFEGLHSDRIVENIVEILSMDVLNIDKYVRITPWLSVYPTYQFNARPLFIMNLKLGYTSAPIVVAWRPTKSEDAIAVGS